MVLSQSLLEAYSLRVPHGRPPRPNRPLFLRVVVGVKGLNVRFLQKLNGHSTPLPSDLLG